MPGATDNYVGNLGVGGETYASDSIASVQYPRVKIAWGVDGVAGDVSAANPLPVTSTVTGSVAVTGTFFQATQPVSIASMPSTPVTGTFWQATQPVSGTVSVNVITGFATEATLAARIPVNGQALMAASVPVTLASNQSALPVTLTSTTITGTVASTQSGTWNIGSITTLPALATGANVIGAVTQSGTWNIGSITTLPALVASSAIIGNVRIDQTTVGTTNAVSVAQLGATAIATSNGVVGAGVQRVAIASDNTAFSVNATPPTLTKGTQGTTGYSVQRLQDAGRNSRAFMLDAYTAAPVAEALQTVVQWYSNAAVAGTTQPAVVPGGKTLRLTNWAISTKSLATVGSAVLRIRANTGGLVVIGSPLVWSAEVGSKSGATTVAMTGGLDTLTGEFPEGFEFPAGTGLGFTLAGYGPTGTLTLQGVTRFQVFGYEY